MRKKRDQLKMEVDELEKKDEAALPQASSLAPGAEVEPRVQSKAAAQER